MRAELSRAHFFSPLVVSSLALSHFSSPFVLSVRLRVYLGIISSGNVCVRRCECVRQYERVCVRVVTECTTTCARVCVCVYVGERVYEERARSSCACVRVYRFFFRAVACWRRVYFIYTMTSTRYSLVQERVAAQIKTCGRRCRHQPAPPPPARCVARGSLLAPRTRPLPRRSCFSSRPTPSSTRPPARASPLTTGTTPVVAGASPLFASHRPFFLLVVLFVVVVFFFFFIIFAVHPPPAFHLSSRCARRFYTTLAHIHVCTQAHFAGRTCMHYNIFFLRFFFST